MAIHPRDPASIRRMFERLAPDYDRLNAMLTFGLVRGWRRALLDAVRPAAGQRLVDVCTGTGAVLAMAAPRVGRRGLAVGIDFTEAMLARARGRRVLGDALRLPFADGSFDVAVSSFALRDVADQQRLLDEMARVTRPGGRLGLLEIGPPRARTARAGFDLWFRGAVPRIGAAFGQGESHRFLVRSVAYLPEPEALAAMLERAGVVDVRWRDLTLGAARVAWGSVVPDPARRPADPPPTGYG